MRIIYNDRLLEAERARVAAVAPVSLYGRGVFTTLAVHGGRPFLWTRHWARLIEHATRTGLDCGGLDEETVAAQLAELIKANRVREGRARLTLLDAARHDGVWTLPGNKERKTDLLMMTGDVRVVPEDGLALTVSPYRANTLSPLSGIKSVNYLSQILAWEEARSRDFDEAVTLNERGEVVSATMSNIFWVTDGTLHTPALATGALSGTTRSCIMELAEELSIPLIEGVYDLSELGHADEIFLTSAGLGVALVTSFDFHRYTIHAGSVTLRLHEAFRQLTLHAE